MKSSWRAFLVLSNDTLFRVTTTCHLGGKRDQILEPAEYTTLITTLIEQLGRGLRRRQLHHLVMRPPPPPPRRGHSLQPLKIRAITFYQVKVNFETDFCIVLQMAGKCAWRQMEDRFSLTITITKQRGMIRDEGENSLLEQITKLLMS